MWRVAAAFGPLASAIYLHVNAETLLQWKLSLALYVAGFARLWVTFWQEAERESGSDG